MFCQNITGSSKNPKCSPPFIRFLNPIMHFNKLRHCSLKDCRRKAIDGAHMKLYKDGKFLGEYLIATCENCNRDRNTNVHELKKRFAKVSLDDIERTRTDNEEVTPHDYWTLRITDACTVEKLREFCRKNSLSTAGNKPVLVERVISFYVNTELPKD